MSSAYAQWFGSECIGEMDSDRLTADGQMEDLANRSVAEIFRRQSILRFRNLLGCSPGCNPSL